MYEVYASGSPNVMKVTICLAELGEDWRDVWMDVSRGDQHTENFMRISPNGKIPLLVDHAPVDGRERLLVWESGAILVYLAEKHGRFLPNTLSVRTDVLTWLFWQMGGLGPMSGQNAHFLQYDPPGNDFAKDRYHTEVERLYRVLDARLQGREWICDDYSIADMACYPWIRIHRMLLHDIGGLHALRTWSERIAMRPAVVEAYRRMDMMPRSTATKDERFENMKPARGLAVFE